MGLPGTLLGTSLGFAAGVVALGATCLDDLVVPVNTLALVGLGFAAFAPWGLTLARLAVAAGTLLFGFALVLRGCLFFDIVALLDFKLAALDGALALVFTDGFAD